MGINWLGRLSGFHRSAPGLEWVLWKRLPLIALMGTGVPVLLWAGLYFLLDGDASASQARWLQLAGYVVLGVLALHWTLVFTVAIGCVIVMVMKGPAYVADGYPVSHRDTPAPALGEKQDPSRGSDSP